MKKANVVLRDMKDVKAKLLDISSIKNDLENLIEINEFLKIETDEEMEKHLEKDTNVLKTKLEKLETKMFLSGKFDKNNAIITLHPGARWYRISRLGSNAL